MKFVTKSHKHCIYGKYGEYNDGFESRMLQEEQDLKIAGFPVKTEGIRYF